MIQLPNILSTLKIKLRNRLFVLSFDIFMIPVAWALAYLLRYNLGYLPSKELLSALKVFPLVFIVQVFLYWYFKLYRGLWRFASTPDLIRIIKTVGLCCITLIISMFFFTRIESIPRSIFPLYGLILISLLSGGRLFYRYAKDKKIYNNKNKQVVIVGAGSAGEMLVRDLLRSSNHDYQPIAFIDDSKNKLGKEIHGIRVLGTTADLPKILKTEKIDLVIIAIPSATSLQMRHIVDVCNHVGVAFQTIPSLSELASGHITVNSLREVAIEDLLGREEVEIDWNEINSAISGHSILVTGGGGSIGSELCRQIASLKPATLVVIENSEYNLYKLDQELRKKFPTLNLQLKLVNVTDALALTEIFNKFKPEIVFHAAAYKHVPILEDQVFVALNNNVIGTKTVAETASKNDVKKFILISTDKAVKPANVMGASKRLAELVCQSLNQNSKTQFLIVRFGNVLGSSGSVVPLFKKQLAQGGPITVTDPEVTRFFMTIPEACRLILQANVLSHGGEIFVLDMGEPIKINYLAEQLIRLSGKEPGTDIKIVYNGLRPGEKIYEELFYQHEEIVRTKHRKIMQAKVRGCNDEFLSDLKNLESLLIHSRNELQFYNLLKKMIPEFNRNNNLS